MPPPKSKVWIYFNRSVDGADCKLCDKKIVSKGGNTTNLAVHLRMSHKIECATHPSIAGLFKKTAPVSCPTDAQLPELPSLPTLPETASTISTCDTETKVVTETKPLMSIWDRARQGKLSADKQSRITRKIGAYLVKEMRPFSTVESESFRERIIPAWYSLESAMLEDELKDTNHIALTSDC